MAETIDQFAGRVLRQLKDVTSLFICVSDDFGVCFKQLTVKPADQFWRRTALRGFSAYVETVVFLFRRLSLLITELNSEALTHAEKAMLMEESYEVDHDGSIRTTQKLIPFKRMLLFVFATTAKATGSSFKLNKADNGFNALQQTMDVRHRLMHPKTSEGMIISDDEMKALEVATDWFHDEMERLMNDSTPEKVFKRYGGMEAVAKRIAARLSSRTEAFG